ncbi:MAG: bifunctional acetate--CoA ligase family protein/GNAT family N-acetyltransferase [Verrucomicrobiae bacterium]|nr:bifunctional acetate--CoA ligase family protein/GNAT family N-acetyltransferase [Verrucomicrobiae bacterium]
MNESIRDLRYERRPLSAIFAPRTVAVIGATEKAGTVGRTILWNLISNPFNGTVFPVNPTRPAVLGIKAYPRIGDVPERVDLAVIVTPAPTVPGVVAECVAAGVRGAIIISAGFKETGPEGVALEKQVLEEARRGRMRIVGPNCLGVMCPVTGVNATFASGMARPGNVGFLSQSGALCTAVLDWSLRENVGFSAFVSLGSMLDVGWGDLISYLGDDPRTESIVIYMESIGDARAFLSAAHEVALSKPVLVIKAGQTEAASKAAASHTGALTGSDEVLDAAFRRCGVLRINEISHLFHAAEVLAKQPRPRGPRLTILTNAGGPGVLATDALIHGGGELAELTKATIASLNKILPGPWSRGNPVDVLGDASPERYAKALEIAAQDPNSDGLLVILTPQAMTDPTQTAEQLKPYAKLAGKPVLASWMGGGEVEAGRAILSRAGIPCFEYPDTAGRIFDYMWQHSDNLRALYETPQLPPEHAKDAPDRARAEKIIHDARAKGRTLLTESESKDLLACYGIPTAPTRIARTAEEAVATAQQIGYPVVLKLFSETITHKTDVGGVRLNLADARAVEQAFRAIAASVQEKASAKDFLGVTVQPMVKLEGYELIIGSSLDPQFGPVLLFGTGGQLVEVFRDRALALPPLTTTLARRMIERTLIYRALKGVRGRAPVDLAALERLLVRFSYLVVEQRWIREIDINPLLASSGQLLALDARVVVHGANVSEADLPRPAIRPYPSQYVGVWTMRDGTEVLVRPIRPEDEPLMVKFHETISDRSFYMRHARKLEFSERAAHERLMRICFTDYAREIVLVVERKGAEGAPEILAVARLNRCHGLDEGEIGILISDRLQHLGLGTELLRRLIEVGREEGLVRIRATMLKENAEMLHLCGKRGFQLTPMPDSALVKGELDLTPSSAAS